MTLASHGARIALKEQGAVVLYPHACPSLPTSAIMALREAQSRQA